MIVEVGIKIEIIENWMINGERLMFSWAKITILRNLIRSLYNLKNREIRVIRSFVVNVKSEKFESIGREIQLGEGEP